MIITKENGKSKTISGCPEPQGAHLKRRCGKGPKRKDGSRSRCLREASLGKQGSSKTSVRTRHEYGRRGLPEGTCGPASPNTDPCAVCAAYKACALRVSHAGCALQPGAGGRAGPDLHHTGPDCKRFMV